MVTLIPQINILNTKYNSINNIDRQVAVTQNTPKENQIQPFELSNMLTTNMLAQFVKKADIIKPINCSSPLERYEWKNDLRTLIQDNKAVIWAMVPRTFNAVDKDRNDLIQNGEEKGTF